MTDTSAGPEMDPKLFDLDLSASLKKIKEALSQLAISADMKALMVDLAGFTVKVAGKVIALGRKILQVALALIRAFPHVAFGAVTALIMGQVIAQVPKIGPKLSAFLTPLMLMAGIGAGAIADLMSGDLGKNVNAFIDAVAELFRSDDVVVMA
jgi:hypothetical protein